MKISKIKARVLLLGVQPPIKVGVYSEETLSLLQSYHSLEQLSQSLLGLYSNIEYSYEITALYYARGPGSLMGMKLIYLFAKTLQITKKLPIFATHSFYFNNKSPIKAYGKMYCTYDATQNPSIFLKLFDTPPHTKEMELPSTLPLEIFSETFLEPLYLTPAVSQD